MNILDLVREDVGESTVVKQTSGEWASPCPTCGGKDRFRTFPDQGKGGTYWCRAENRGGDIIQYLRDFRSMAYREACTFAGVEAASGYRPLAAPRRKGEARGEYAFKTHDDPAMLWQEKARSFVTTCHQRLLANPPMLAYLASRGVSLEAAKRCRLGYNPKPEYRSRTAWGLTEETSENGKAKRLWLPKGIVIPYWRERKLQRIKIRQDNGFEFGPRYYMVPGSSSVPMCLNPEARAFVVVEAELDAIACWDATAASGRQEIGALGMGTLGGKPDEWLHGILTKCLCILNALDVERVEPENDTEEAREKAERTEAMQARQRDWWQATYPQAERWPVPAGKDPGEAVAHGVDLAMWILAGLPPAFTLPPFPSGKDHRREAADAGEAPSIAETAPPPKAIPASVLQLNELLRSGPMWIEKDDATTSLGIKWDWQWRLAKPENAALCNQLSHLVFRTDAFDWVVAHGAAIIDCRNLLNQ
ncbi:primase-helicase zinc-binding domain-containing protein [Desulfovibrio subterraneus]|uniref:Primase n=1 Tax=Desulfovibrio subterraneus TaxID=2718620 RepID=A0A7J0BHZ8_9BACT|nr:primase-helicase zinc-binding domain-containing protein [Desulfovibrio subterraneus]GFM33307.1 primase [Desulfovibrio subterraneus]